MKELTARQISLLLSWYGEHKRSLPWRENVTPYRVWVSEIMLQQTRVEAARDYYLKWMERFPTLSDLAVADEEEVLKQWEGLGYYSRARNLHKAAKILFEKGADLPADRAALRALPGIGAYTVGAILSIAFGIPEPAVDGNVMRVVSRLTADGFDQSKDEVRAAIADRLRPLIPQGRSSDFTQSLFELGALICLPNTMPKCDACPLKGDCEAHRLNREEDFPVKVTKAEKRREKLTVLVLELGGKFAVKKRSEKGLLAGLWELPNLKGELSAEEVEKLFDGSVTPLPPATHVFTHIVWEMTGYYVRLQKAPKDASLVFVSSEDLAAAYALPSAFKKYRKYCMKK